MTTARVLRLLRVSVTVADVSRAAAFYRDALGFTDEAAPDAASARLLGASQVRYLRLGEQMLELLAFDPPGRPYPAGSTSTDLWFQHIAIVTGDMAAAHERLARFAITPISQGGPQVLPAENGGVTAFKFRDPEGHPLELLQFPPGTGAAQWQRAGVFLGFDHSAISVADVDRSIGFYGGVLGLSVAARTLNHGPVQERLDGVAGARADVVALQPAAAATPHVELLAYHPPGRAMPVEMQDVAAARLVFAVDDLDALAAASPGTTITDVGGGARAALVRDPDGHGLVLVQA